MFTHLIVHQKLASKTSKIPHASRLAIDQVIIPQIEKCSMQHHQLFLCVSFHETRSEHATQTIAYKHFTKIIKIYSIQGIINEINSFLLLFTEGITRSETEADNKIIGFLRSLKKEEAVRISTGKLHCALWTGRLITMF